jgi:hypothetical protein
MRNLLSSLAIALSLTLSGCVEDGGLNLNPSSLPSISSSQFRDSVDQPITLAKYNQIQVGMSLAEVNIIFGGIPTSSETLNYSGLISTVYQYKNPDGRSWVNISVDTSDRVTFISQVNLR